MPSTRGGRSSTTSAPTAPPRSPELLVVFKAARRQEYLQQNLRILSAPRGETVETTYGLRWQADGIRRRPPEPGEEALIVFTSQPYRRFTPARFGRVVSAEVDEGALRMRLELGSRARASDAGAWERFVLGGPNPSEQSEIWIFRVEDERSTVGLGPGSTGQGSRPPVEYATTDQDERAWRDTIERLAGDGDYRGAVFLRVTTVRPAAEGAGPAIEPPYRLRGEQPYLVRVGSYNPHLAREALSEARLVPLYDELATALVIDHAAGIPRDGAVDILIEPIVGGPGWLELNVSLGLDLVPAASLGWVAEASPTAGSGARPAERPVAQPEEPDTGPVGEWIAPALGLEPSDPVADGAMRAFAVAVEAGMDAELRIRLLRYLRAIAPAETRLAEAEAIALYELDRFEEARAILAEVPLDVLGAEGRATLLAAMLRTTGIPEPIERVRMADLARAEAFQRVLDASAALPPSEQFRLTEFVVGRLLSDDRAVAWLAALVSRELPPTELSRLIDLLADVDQPAAAVARERLAGQGRL